MRYFIEEMADVAWPDIKEYILSIKDFTSDELMDEALNNRALLKPNATYLNSEDWREEYKNYRKDNEIESLITDAVEEKFYIFDDEDEHAWNKSVVHSVINGESWTHRWSNEKLK